LGPVPFYSRVAAFVTLLLGAALVPAAGDLDAQAPVRPAANAQPAPRQEGARLDAPGAVAPGDRIILRVWREPSWSDSLVVGPDGAVTLPRVGRFVASGLTPLSLADSVRTRLAFYLRDPSIDLVVLRRVAVLGAVKKPDVYFVDPVTSLREVLAIAGGIDDSGDPNRIEIVRDGASQRLGKWREVAESTAPVRSGDQVIVGRRAWFTRNALTVVSSVAVIVSVLLSATR
jgi:polysaccharide export outer membrane protein